MSEILTLMLAWRMAKQYKEDESKAIYLCAINICKQIKNDNMQNLVMQLAQIKTTDKQRIKAVEQLEAKLRKNNLI